MKDKNKYKYLKISSKKNEFKNKEKNCNRDEITKTTSFIKCDNCKFENLELDEKGQLLKTCKKCGYPLNFEIKPNIKIYKIFLFLGIIYVVVIILFLIAKILIK